MNNVSDVMYRKWLSAFACVVVFVGTGNALAASPERLANIEGATDSALCGGVALRDKVLFGSRQPPLTSGVPTNCRLFSSDDDLVPATRIGPDLHLSGILPLRDRALFIACVTTTSCALWSTDGTSAGTEQLTAGTVAGFYTGVVDAVRGRYWFPTYEVDRPAVWMVTEGTAASTRVVGSSSVSSPRLWATNSEALMSFGTDPKSGRVVIGKLSISTGSEEIIPIVLDDLSRLGFFLMVATETHVFLRAFKQTDPVSTIPESAIVAIDLATQIATSLPIPASNPGASLDSDGRWAYFQLCGRSSAVCNIWRSDGTVSATQQLTAHTVPTPSGRPLEIVQDPTGYLHVAIPEPIATAGLFRLLDGRIDLVTEGRVTFHQRGAAGSYFCVESKDKPSSIALYRTQGDTLVPKKLADVCALSGAVLKGGITLNDTSAYWASQNASGLVFFARIDLLSGRTSVVKGLPSASAQFGPVHERPDGVVLLGACNVEVGCELWRTDGTPSGTFRLSDFVAGPSGSRPRYFYAVGRLTFFIGFDGPVEFEDTATGARMFIGVTDGTVAGTRKVRSLSASGGFGVPYGENNEYSYFSEINGVAHFVGCITDSLAGCGVWRTDGTDAGTLLVVPLPTNEPSFRIRQLVPFRGGILFSWCTVVFPSVCSTYFSDGRLENTIALGSAAFVPDPVVLGAVAYFADCNEVVLGCRLKRTDGTLSGTVVDRDMFPREDLRIIGLHVVGNRLILATKSSRDGPVSLFSTSAGAPPVPLRPLDSFTTAPSTRLLVGGRLWFVIGAASQTSRTLWVTDGTPGGTRSVSIEVGEHDPSIADRLIRAGDGVIFRRCSLKGCELARATADGLVGRFVRLMSEDDARETDWPLAATNGRLIFAGRDIAEGLELWALDMPNFANGDLDLDGIPDAVEIALGLDPTLKDNDIFANTPLGTKLFVMQQYRDLLRREATEAELVTGEAALASGQSKAAFIESLMMSPASADLAGPVARLYQAYFLRRPDTGGFDFWMDSYRKQNPWTFIAISNFFATSDEFKQRYGALNNEQFVTLIYNNILSRAPDATGLSFWLSELTDGRRSRGQVMADFSESPENKLKTKGWVQVVTAYTRMLQQEVDEATLAQWVPVANAGGSLQPLIEQLLAKPEYRARFLP